LPNPTAAEIEWARRLLRDANERQRFLSAASRNAAWFKALASDLQRLLGDEAAVNQVLWFVALMPAECLPATIAMVRPYLRRDGAWSDRLGFVIGWIREWVDPLAIEFFDEVMQAGAALPDHFFQFQAMARLDAGQTAVAVLHLLDAKLQTALDGGDAQHRDVADELRSFSNGSSASDRHHRDERASDLGGWIGRVASERRRRHDVRR
jgi:hypothetical protein